MRAVVIAVADLGRAARMCNHARGLAANQIDVDLVGLEGTPAPTAIPPDPRIPVPRFVASTLRGGRGLSAIAYSFAALVDAARLGYRLWRPLRRLPPPSLVIVQNPPQFP